MTPQFFISNRSRLVNALVGGITVISANSRMQRGNDASYKFEQESNFWWLTGIVAPDWWIVVDGTRGKSWLVAPHVSESHRIFDGSLSYDEAKNSSGIDQVIDTDAGMSLLRELAKKHSVVYTLGDPPHAEYFDFVLNPAQKKLKETVSRLFASTVDCRHDIAKLRAIKQPEEITAIKKAIKLTTAGFEEVRKQLPSLRNEYEVEALFTYEFRRHGAEGHAYDPIVAVGKNACTLHYVDNNERLKKSNLLLLDIGAKVEGYCADITRTFAYGQPTKRQQVVHGAVQRAHNSIIQSIRPGVAVVEYLTGVENIMMKALIELGLAKNENDQTALRTYFPHAISHGLGVDVHDSLGGASHFEPGMVLTVEPGIYIPEESIGVRIEDDVLVTESGVINLSKHLSTDY